MAFEKPTLRVGVLALLLLAPAAAQAQEADTVVARVNGADITLGHMIALRERLPQQVRQLPDEMLFEGILDQLIEQAALADEAGDAVSLRARLQLDNSMREIRANSLLTEAAVGAADDDAVAAAYAARFADGGSPEFNAAHILVQTEDEAAALRARLDEGADFAALAAEHSLDGSAAGGGDLGWFGPGMMVEPFEAAVMALAPGDISDPVQTQFGWHLVKLIDTRTAEAPPLEDVRAELVQELQQQAVLARIAAARDAAEIEVLAEGIDPAVIADQTLIDD